MNKEERKKYLLTKFAWILIPLIILTGFILLAVFKWNSGTLPAKILLVICIAFGSLITAILTIFTLETVIKCAMEEKVEHKGYHTTSKIIKVSFKESTDIKGYGGVRITTLFKVKIEYLDPETKEIKHYTFGKGMSRQEVNYLLSLERVKIITDGRTCFLNEDLEKSINMPLDKLNDEKIHVIRFDSKDKKKIYNAVIWLSFATCISFAFALLLSCIVRKDAFSGFSAMLLMAISIVQLINNIKNGRKNKLLAKLGKKSFADSFKKEAINSGPEPDLDHQFYRVVYTFTTDDGQVITAEDMLAPSDYAIIDTLEKLPIIVYQDYSMVDFDRFPKI